MAQGFILEMPEQLGQPGASTHQQAVFGACSVEDARKIVGKTALDFFRREAR